MIKMFMSNPNLKPFHYCVEELNKEFLEGVKALREKHKLQKYGVVCELGTLGTSKDF